MRKSMIIFCVLLTIFIVILSLICIFKNKSINDKFTTNSSDKYIFTSNLKYLTMQNDGGSHINEYYQVNLKDKIVKKYQDKYKGFEGYVYKAKIIKTVNLNDEQAQKIKKIFNEIIENKEESKDISTIDYNFYTLTINENENIKVNDYDVINQFLDIVDKEMLFNKNSVDSKENELKSNSDNIREDEDMKINIKIGDENLTATLVDNTSSRELLNRLQQKDVTIKMNDYANIEKVGKLEFDLPRNDENIQTEAGDIILYQGNSFVIYYDNNNYSLTKLGKIDNINKDGLKSILGTGQIEIIISKK